MFEKKVRVNEGWYEFDLILPDGYFSDLKIYSPFSKKVVMVVSYHGASDDGGSGVYVEPRGSFDINESTFIVFESDELRTENKIVEIEY